MERRKFIETLPLLSLLSLDASSCLFNVEDNEKVQWEVIKDMFPKKDFLHLNSGSGGTMPLAVQSLVINLLKESGKTSIYKSWEWQKDVMDSCKESLSSIIGVDKNEIAINRNATDGINSILFGLQLEKGDAILSANHDYFFVNKAIEHRAIKDGIRPIILSMDIAKMKDEEIIESYDNALTEDVKLLVLTLMTHREGRILPVKEITKKAHKKGISVFVDGAQAFGHFEHNVTDLACDFYVTSLHKWLNAPSGSGLIFVKKNWIDKIDPPLALHPDQTSIKKFEYLGTSAFHQWGGIIGAIQFLSVVSIAEKQERLLHLTNYWQKLFQNIDNVDITKINGDNCIVGIGSFGVESIGSKKLQKKLFDDYKINVKSVGIKNNGSRIRVSPNVFTLEEDLDYFASAVQKLVR